MSKYVIKNCPAYMYDKQFNRNVCKKNLIPYETCCEECQDINDCIIKRIVEKCREDEKPIILDVHEEAKDGMIVGRMLLKKEILDMLDIEECE